jgi:hypothetical protein
MSASALRYRVRLQLVRGTRMLDACMVAWIYDDVEFEMDWTPRLAVVIVLYWHIKA